MLGTFDISSLHTIEVKDTTRVNGSQKKLRREKICPKVGGVPCLKMETDLSFDTSDRTKVHIR